MKKTIITLAVLTVGFFGKAQAQSYTYVNSYQRSDGVTSAAITAPPLIVIPVIIGPTQAM